MSSVDDEPLSPDEESLSPEDTPLGDPEVPEADALDQAREVGPAERLGQVTRAIDAPEADSIEQAMEVPVDDDEDRP
jgi:hypothetical protein